MNKNISFDNSDIYYRVDGTGQPVVLVHGFGEDGSIWDELFQRLKSKYKVIIPDLPGSGKSTTENDDLSMEFMADCIHAVLTAEQVISTAGKESKVRVIVIGHSMGGYITLAFAEKYPQLLKAFGLFHSAAFPDSEEKKEARRKSISFIRQHGAALFIEQSTPKLFSEDFKKKHPEIVRELVDRFTNFSGAALVHYYEAMMQRPDRTEILKKFKGPILFIMGKHDSAIPLEQSLQECHLPELSHVKILENSGHMGMFEEPEKTGPFIEKFLAEIEIANPYQRYS